MKARFFIFNKRLRTTEQPSDELDHIDYDVVMKQQTSYLNPSLLVDTSGIYPTANYLALYLNIDDEDVLLAYYFIDDVKISNTNIFEIVCSIDALATCRDEILNTNAYILYASKNYNRWLKDDRVPILPDCETARASANLKEHQSGNPILAATHQNSVVIVTTINKYYGLCHYVMHEDDLVDVMQAVSNASSSVWQSLSEQFGAAINSIVQVIRLPINDNIIPVDSGKFLQLGDYQVVPTDPSQPAYSFPCLTRSYIQCECDVGIPAGYLDFRLAEPYQQIKLSLPAVGVVDLNLADFREDGNVSIYGALDLLTGVITYKIVADDNPNKPIMSFSGQLGTFIPFVANQIANSASLVQTTAGGLAALGMSLATGNPLPAVAGGIATVAHAFYASNQKATSVIGSYSGNRSDVISNSVTVTLIKYKTSIEPDNLTDLEGRPVAKVDNLASYVGGYIRCNKFELSGTHLKGVKEKVNQLLDSGIYLI